MFGTLSAGNTPESITWWTCYSSVMGIAFKDGRLGRTIVAFGIVYQRHFIVGLAEFTSCPLTTPSGHLADSMKERITY